MKLNNKIAVITGATGVIGGKIAESFISEGCKVIACGRSEDKLEEIKKKYPEGSVTTYKADVAIPEQMQGLFNYVQDNFGKLDILVTAAGIYGEMGLVEQIDPENWMKAIEVNLFGTVISVKYAINLLRKSESPRIILFAGGGEGPMSGFTSYVCSKGAVLRLNESLSEELSDDNIMVNAIYPGLVNSGFVRDLIKAGEDRVGKEKYRQAMDQIAGVSETFGPERASEFVMFLCSNESDGITGKLFAARWDSEEIIERHKSEIMESKDIYTPRRIKPNDRGYEW